MHIMKEYETGIGHIDQKGPEQYLVSFYGRRVRQIEVASVQHGRWVLRRLASGMGV